MLRCLLLLLFTFSGLIAAEIRDGLLYLEINLASSTELNLKAKSGSVDLSDESQLFESSVSGDFRVSVVNPNVSYLYGILERSESASQIQSADTVQSFAWEDGKLLIKNEIRYFYPESFSSSDSARAYAIKHGYPFSSIVEIPMANSTLKVEESTGRVHYFESPLSLHSTGQLELNGLTYEGDFVLEVAQGKLQLNQYVALEEYIAGVLPNEIGPNSPLEALKAQAVAARTHAVSLLTNNRHKEQGYDLCSSTHCQVYKGKHLRNPLIEEAVMQSASEILILDARVADATYHSSCGGKTDSSANIWKSKPLPHLSGSLCYPEADDYDLSTEEGVAAWLEHKPDTTGMSSWERASLSWKRSISRSKLASNLGLNQLREIRILNRGDSGRILKMAFIGEREVVLDGEFKIRQAFGNLPSSLFYLQGMRGTDRFQPPSQIEISGRGSGHGVGLCQVGALRKARTGMTYEEILQNYYPHTVISTDWMPYEP